MKKRCTFCREYFDAEEMYRQGVGGVCSAECLADLVNKTRAKRVRRAENRAKAKKKERYGSRLSGTLRDRIRRRDGDCCRYCGRNGPDLQIHHIEYRSQGGPDAAWNLILLCAEHHALMHSSKIYWQPLLRGVIWKHYVDGSFLLVPELERRLKADGFLWYEPDRLVTDRVQRVLEHRERAA